MTAISTRVECMAVCDKTFHLLQREPYSGLFEIVEPLTPIPLSAAGEFDCRRNAVRTPRESKGPFFNITTDDAGSCCSTDGSCC